MNRIRAAAAIHMQDKFSWLILPWLILSFSFLINLIISHTVVENVMITGGIATVHIFMLVYGVLAITSTFPFAIGFSVRRTDFLLGTFATFVGVSLWSSILLWLLGVIEHSTNGWGSDLAFFHLPYVSDGSALEQIAFQAAVMLFCFMLGFLPAAIHRRAGTSGMMIVFVAVSLLFTIAGYVLAYLDLWPAIWKFLFGLRSIELAAGLFAAAVVMAAVSFLLMRRATVR